MKNISRKFRRLFNPSNNSSISAATIITQPTDWSGARPVSAARCLQESVSPPNPSPTSPLPYGHGVIPSSAIITEVTSPEESNAMSDSDPRQFASHGPSKTPWEKAIEKLKPDDRRKFRFHDTDKLSTLAEVLEAAKAKQRECQEKQWRYRKDNKEVILRDLAERILTNLHEFANFGNAFFQHMPQFVAMAWAPFCFLLQVTSNDMETMENLMSELEYISRILSRCATYERLYSKSDLRSARDFMDSLPDLYVAILIYLWRSQHYFSRNTAIRYVNSIVSPYAAEFYPLVKRFKELEQSMENAARAAADESQAEEFMKNEKIRSDEERSKILEWLSEVTYEQHHGFIQSSRQPGTGNWLLQKREFIQWRKSKSSSILWLHGIAGAGKTTLASLVVDECHSIESMKHAMAYFYCKYGEKDRRDPESILRTIVKQLSIRNHRGSLPEPVVSLYRKRKEGGKSRSLQLVESKELILQLAGGFKQTVIVIDALDECDKSTRGNLLDALKSLLRSSTEAIKLFVTSRDDDDILLKLEDVPNVYIQSSDNRSDIELFVVEEVGRCISEKELLRGSVRPELKQVIVDTLTKKAHGMFLWARLQIKHICLESSEMAIRTALKRLPKDLESTYSVIWDRICADTEDNYLLAERTLKWIMCAEWPLTPKEMIYAVSAEPTQWRENPDHVGLSEMTLLAVCQNLVVIDKKLDVFRPAHFSVTEFLRKKLKMSEAHTAAADICLTLCCENIKSSHQAGTEIVGNGVLSMYAMANWATHVRCCGDGSKFLMDWKKEFFKPSSAYYKWLLSASKKNRESRSQNEENQLAPLRLACYHFWDIFECLSQTDADCNIRYVKSHTPLHLIASYGYDAGVKLLLESENVDLNAKDDHGWTPLCLAVEGGHEAVVRLLLEKEGVDLNCAENTYRWTPLHIAVKRKLEAMVSLLLEKEGVALNAKDKYDQTPLSIAVERGYEGVVRLLLGREEVDLNCAASTYGWTPLLIAADRGFEAVVRLLLGKKNVDVNCVNLYGWTPLYAAADKGFENVVRLLLEKEGVDFNRKNTDGRTPIRAAAEKGHDPVVRLLLEKEGVDFNCKDAYGWTPLYAAAENGYEAVVRLLLEKKGVNLNAKREYDNKTPLYTAAESGHEAVVRLLLEKEDVDLNCKNIADMTPLHAAATNGHVAVVRLLLEKEGVCLNCKSAYGLTVLHSAAMNRRHAIVKLLLKKEGVDLYCEDNDGRTALDYIAAMRGNHTVIRLLETRQARNEPHAEIQREGKRCAKKLNGPQAPLKSSSRIGVVGYKLLDGVR